MDEKTHPSAGLHPEGQKQASAAVCRAYQGLADTVQHRHGEIDRFHDLIARYGLNLLEQPTAYVLVAVKHANYRAFRQNERFHFQDPSCYAGDHANHVELSFDPLEMMVRSETTRELLAAFQSLEARDIHLLWWSAHGATADEIRVMWDDRQFLPAAPNDAYLRKRRERARSEMRRRLTRGADRAAG